MEIPESVWQRSQQPKDINSVYTYRNQVSAERFQVIKAFGAEVIKLSGRTGYRGNMEKTGGDFIAAVAALRDQVLAKEEGIFFVDQLSNPANPAVHESTTGPEIWEDTNGNVDILVASVGTGGTVSGTGKYLKSKNPDLYVVALQPGKNSLPSPENPAPEEIMGVHPFAGVPREMVPEIMDMDIYDERYDVETPDAYRVTREVAKTDGILVGTSSGAAIFAATEIAKRPENAGKNIVVILPDTGLRYLSTNLFNEDFVGIRQENCCLTKTLRHRQETKQQRKLADHKAGGTAWENI